MSNGVAYGTSEMSSKEMCMSFVESKPKIPLEEVGEYDMIFDIKLAGWDWMYSRYGLTVRDRGITEKRPFWYFLRSLLPTFGTEDQTRFTALSGISINDSLALRACEDACILVDDADRLVSIHYFLACGWRSREATRAKHAWYEIAGANPTITVPFLIERLVNGKRRVEQMCAPTFAQLEENLKIPGKDGLYYFIPDIDPDCYFLSDDPKTMQEQLKGRRCIIDP
jgi:hypothetical protein